MCSHTHTQKYTTFEKYAKSVSYSKTVSLCICRIHICKVHKPILPSDKKFYFYTFIFRQRNVFMFSAYFSTVVMEYPGVKRPNKDRSQNESSKTKNYCFIQCDLHNEVNGIYSYFYYRLSVV